MLNFVAIRFRIHQNLKFTCEFKQIVSTLLHRKGSWRLLLGYERPFELRLLRVSRK